MDLGLSWIEWLWFPQGAHLILVIVVFSMPHQDLVILFPIWACMALVTLVLTQASLGPGYSIPHLDLTLTRDLWSHLGLNVNWLLWFPSRPHPYLVTLVTPWASLGPGELVLSWSTFGSGDWSPLGLTLTW